MSAPRHLTLGQLGVNFAVSFLGTVGTILAALVAYGAWAMEWPVVFVVSGSIAVICYTLQWTAVYGNDQPFLLRVFRSVARIGPWIGILGGVVSLLSGMLWWSAGFVAVGVVAIYLRILLSG